MAIYDISLGVSESLLTWPGDPPIRLAPVTHLDWGDEATVTKLEMSAHTGTHLDAPAHFIAGTVGVDALDLSVLVGPARVVEARGVAALAADVLAGLEIPRGTERLLFRTDNSELWTQAVSVFRDDFVGLTSDGARWLVDRDVKLVGLDYLSVGTFADTVATHQILLRAGIIPVEGLNLGGIPAGDYQLICLPLKILGCDGAPARAILIR